MNLKEQIKKLPLEAKNFFLSNSSRLEMERSCLSYGLGDNEIEIISEILGDYFLKEMPLFRMPEDLARRTHLSQDIANGVAHELISRCFLPFKNYFMDSEMLLDKLAPMMAIPMLSEEIVEEKLKELEPWIVEDEIEKENDAKENVKKFEAINISNALEKYPNLAEQNISEQELKLQNSLTPVRPSIKNWIADYRDNLGARKHSPVERGNYLFHSENGKRLSSVDRMKVSLILKSLDEDFELTVDTKSQQIVLDSTFNEKENESPVISNQQVTIGQNSQSQDFISSIIGSHARGEEVVRTNLKTDASRQREELHNNAISQTINISSDKISDFSAGQPMIPNTIDLRQSQPARNIQPQRIVEQSNNFAKTLPVEETEDIFEKFAARSASVVSAIEKGKAFSPNFANGNDVTVLKKNNFEQSEISNLMVSDVAKTPLAVAKETIQTQPIQQKQIFACSNDEDGYQLPNIRGPLGSDNYYEQQHEIQANVKPVEQDIKAAVKNAQVSNVQSEPSITFSSAQKLPAEQTQPKQRPKLSPFRISPSHRFNDENVDNN